MKTRRNWALPFFVVLMIFCIAFGILAYAEEDDNDDPVFPPRDDRGWAAFLVYGKNGGQTDLEFPGGTKITKIKLRNKAFSARVKYKGKGEDRRTYLCVYTKKAANGHISFTASLGDETLWYSTPLYAIEYHNPFKMFKIGDQDFTSKFDKDDKQVKLKKPVEGKIQIKMNKGYKLRKIYVLDSRTWDIIATVKNNTTVTLESKQCLKITYTIKGYTDPKIGWFGGEWLYVR